MLHPCQLTDPSRAPAAGEWAPAAREGRRAAQIRTAILMATFLASLLIANRIEAAWTDHNAARIAAKAEGGV